LDTSGNEESRVEVVEKGITWIDVVVNQVHEVVSLSVNVCTSAMECQCDLNLRSSRGSGEAEYGGTTAVHTARHIVLEHRIEHHSLSTISNIQRSRFWHGVVQNTRRDVRNLTLSSHPILRTRAGLTPLVRRSTITAEERTRATVGSSPTSRTVAFRAGEDVNVPSELGKSKGGVVLADSSASGRVLT